MNYAKILRILIPIVLLCAVAALIFAFARPPRTPVYGTFTSQDLVTFTDYAHADLTKVIPNELETMRMVNQLGLPKTLTLLSHSPAYQNQALCHDAAHAVGRAAFDLLGAEAIGECTTACFSGCYHGVFQRMSARIGGEGALIDAVNTLCGARETKFQKNQCFHGAGHGFMLYMNYDLEKALAACRALGGDLPPGWCYGGVFMENLGNGPLAAEMVSPEPPKDLHFPCDSLGSDTTAVKWCYQLQPDLFLTVYHTDFQKASAECMRAPAFARPDCFKRLGQLSGADTPDPPGNTERFCTTVPDAYYADCIIGSVRQVIDFTGIDASAPPATFCKGFSSAKAKEICYGEYAERLKNLFNDLDTRLSLCGKFEAPYDAACRAAQPLPASPESDVLIQ
jgi:hypothetical protein